MLLSTRKQWLLTLISLLAIAVNGCDRTSPREVVVYVSVDRIYAEPILEKFSQATGIKVLPVYDVEATKTTGLANRLLLEKIVPRRMSFGVGSLCKP
ncbi:hypothetical protein NON20_22355 [Synechocystis sp. B12]|nr:hypothetical protein NON20_22355 [Synechocystis sp. B12]